MGAKQSVAVGCGFWQLCCHCDAEGLVLLRWDWEVGGKQRRRERAECLIFAGRGEKCYLGGSSLQRPIHLSSWHPSRQGVGVRVGGVKRRESERRVGGGYAEKPMLLGSQPKSRAPLMGSPLLCDPSLEN